VSYHFSVSNFRIPTPSQTTPQHERKSGSRLAIMMLLLLLLLYFFAFATALPFAVQSDDGDIAGSVATSMFVDPGRARVYVTGSTNGFSFAPGTSPYKVHEQCFVAILQLPHRKGDTEPVWIRRFAIGDSELYASACSSIDMTGDFNSTAHFYLGGYTGAKRLDGDYDPQGFVAEMSLFGQMQQKVLLDDNDFEVPLAVMKDYPSGDLIVAVSISDGSLEGDSSFQTRMGQLEREGNSLQIKRIQSMVSPFESDVLPSGTTRTYNVFERTDHLWKRRFQAEQGSVFAAMLRIDEERIVLAKSDTSGQSFLGFVDSRTGSTIREIQVLVPGHPDVTVFGLCLDSSRFSVYVVGKAVATGAATSTVFVSELNTETYEAKWTTTLESFGSTEAWACTVSASKDSVFVSGNAKEGARVLDSESFGGDDILVAKFNVEDGSIVFVRQVGSDQDDTVAHGNSISLDSNGDAIVLGNSKGSLFRQKRSFGEGDASDVVIFSVGGLDGAITGDRDERSQSPAPTTVPTSLQVEDDPDDHGIKNEPKKQKEDPNVSKLAVAAITFACIAVVGILCKVTISKSSLFDDKSITTETIAIRDLTDSNSNEYQELDPIICQGPTLASSDEGSVLTILSSAFKAGAMGRIKRLNDEQLSVVTENLPEQARHARENPSHGSPYYRSDPPTDQESKAYSTDEASSSMLTRWRRLAWPTEVKTTISSNLT